MQDDKDSFDEAGGDGNLVMREASVLAVIEECISGRNYLGILLLQNVEETPDGRCNTFSPQCKDWKRLQCPDAVLYI